MDSQLVFAYDPTPLIHTDSILSGCLPFSKTFDFELPYAYFDSLRNFNWSVEPGGATSSNKPFSPLFDEIGEFTVILNTENIRGCKTSDSIKVLVGDAVTLPDLFFQDSICAGNKQGFTHSPLVGTDSIKYYIGYSTLSMDSTFAYFEYGADSISTLYRPIDVGDMYLRHKAIYNGCTTYSDIDSIFIHGPIAHFDAISHCRLDSLKFTLNPALLGAYGSFEWNFGDGSAPNSTDLQPTHVFPIDSAYKVSFTVYNADSSCNYTYFSTVSAEPPPRINLTGNTDFCVGDSTYFFAHVQNRYDTLLWFINDSLVMKDELSLSFVWDKRETVELKIIAKNKYGCEHVLKRNISFSKPYADFSVEYTKSCIPFPIKIYNKSSTPPFSSIDSLFWNFTPWGADTNVEMFTKQITSAMTVSARLIAQDNLGCRDTLFQDSLLVVKDNNLSFWAPDKTICLGDTVYFENFSAIKEPHYQWVFGDGDTTYGYNSKHLFTQAGTYNITLSYVNDTLCKQVLELKNYITVQDKPVADFTADTLISPCYPLPVTFQDLSTNPDIVSWQWDFGDGAKSTFQHPFHNYIKPGKYDVQLIVKTSNGCSDTIIKPQYIQTTGPTAEFSVSPDTACMNELFHFNISKMTNTGEFQWDFGDGNSSNIATVSHRYSKVGDIYPSLILSDHAGVCTVKLNDTIYVIEVFADFEASLMEICEGDKVGFQNTSKGAQTLRWSFGDGSSSTISNPEHIFTTPGKYKVLLEIAGAENCKDTISKSITVNPKPEVSVSTNTTICLGDTTILQASGGGSYFWSPSGSLSDATLSNPKAFPKDETVYKVVVENSFGCKDSASVTIGVRHPPIHSIFEDTTLIIGETILLKPADNPGFSFQWSPEIWLNCSDCQNPSAQPLKSTTYVLHTFDPFGCFSIFDTIHIEVKEAYSLNVPNAFTPNGDGNNDVIHVRGWGIRELLEFKIYNRWGEVVFETDDISKGWDGYYKGKLQNVETYVYTVRARMWNEEVRSGKGNISLLR